MFPGCLLVVLDAIHHVATSVSMMGATVAVGNHDLAVVVAGDQLIVGIDLVILVGPIEVALGFD